MGGVGGGKGRRKIMQLHFNYFLKKQIYNYCFKRNTNLIVDMYMGVGKVTGAWLTFKGSHS